MMLLSKVPESRKLTGLVVTGIALFAMLTIAVIVILASGETDLISLFVSFGGYILGIGTSHQAAQAMADRSPNYPNETSQIDLPVLE